MHNAKGPLNESDKAAIIRKINEGLSVSEACERYGVDERLIHNWQAQLPDGQVSFAERIRLLEQEVARLNQRVSDLEQP